MITRLLVVAMPQSQGGHRSGVWIRGDWAQAVQESNVKTYLD